MKSRNTLVCMLAFTLAACSTAPTLTQLTGSEQPTTQEKKYSIQALRPAFASAVASSAELGVNGLPSAPGNAIDTNNNTAWRSSFRPRTATLTVALTSPMVLSQINLRMNTFLPGTFFNVQTSINGRTWRTLSRRQTSVPTSNVNDDPNLGTLVLGNLTGPAATAKFIRLSFQNTASVTRRVGNFFVSNLNVVGTATDLANGGVPNFNWLDLIGAVPQNRPAKGRLRFEAAGLAGDPPQVTLNDVGFDVLSAAPTLRLTGSAILRAGGVRVLNVPEIALDPVPDGVEPGIVFGTDAAGDEIELIWPELGGDPPGNAIVRIQDNNIPRNFAGQLAEATFTLKAYARGNDTDPTNDVLVYQWTCRQPVPAEIPAAR